MNAKHNIKYQTEKVSINFLARKSEDSQVLVWGWLSYGDQSYSFWNRGGKYQFKIMDTYVDSRSSADLEDEKINKGYLPFWGESYRELIHHKFASAYNNGNFHHVSNLSIR